MLAKAGFGFGKVSAGTDLLGAGAILLPTRFTLYPYDPAMAEKMLDAAGYPKKPDGMRFSMRLSFDQKEGP